MAKLSLRMYNREIESLVDRGQLDEAIAHCRHVLNTFPKYLETYRLIGKAYLEAKRYTEATDIFERLLMAVPDDFVAHVGMSIIHDEQKSMDAAIWHMERAFEVQPSNAAIQGELQRLYGRRDGVEPPKIRLTRGALAHMYVQGELYPQAISEIKSVLDEDRDRHDMQVLLARAYFHAGQKSEAAEMCAQLLGRYPYCLDANRVLVELLPETGRGESVQVYRQRVIELDPYSASVTGSVFHTDEVADAAVSLESLDWDGQPVVMQPEWDRSMGIGRDEGAAVRDEEPAWLKAGRMDEAPAASVSTEEPAAVSTGEDIPEFMRELGWTESTGDFQEGSATFEDSEESPAEPIAQGDLPDWVKAMAPTGADLESAAPQTGPGEDLGFEDTPAWLQGLGAVQSMPPAEQPLADEAMPEWLESMKPTEEATPQEEEQLTPVSETEEEYLPDWLKSMQPGEQAAMQETSQETLAGEETSLAEWELGAEAPASPIDSATTEIGGLGTSAAEQDDAIAWLEGLAAKHGAKPEELVTKPEDRKETEPDWVQQIKEAGIVQPPLTAEEPAGEPAAPVGLPDFLAEEETELGAEPAVAFDSVDTGALGTSAEEQDDAIAWLEGLAAKHGARPEELVTKPEERKESEPDWIQRAKEAGAAALPAEEQPEQPFMEEPVSPAGVDETGMWLKDLGEGGFEEQETTGETEPFAEEAGPGWLRGMEEGVSDTEAAQTSGEEAQVPDWLRSIEAGPSQAESLPAFASEEEAISEPGEEAPGKVDFGAADDLGGQVEPSEVGATAPTGESDLTEWLRSMDAGSAEAEIAEVPAEKAPSEDLPFWLAGLDSEAEQKPAAAADEGLPDWLRAEAEQEPVQVEPTSPADWHPSDVEEPVRAEEPFAPKAVVEPAPEPAAQVPAPVPVEIEPRHKPEPVTRSRSGMTGMLSAVQEPGLTQAQNELTRGNIPGAMEGYGKLIKKGKMLEEIIFDLREALYRYPVEVIILQTLGDAYMRANRLQDALDAYTKAEELLR